MRALFVTWAWGSHFYPTVPLGWALRAAGHEVLVASQPSFSSTITRAGLPALPVGADVDIYGPLRETYQGWQPSLERSAAEKDARERQGITSLEMAAKCAEAMADETMQYMKVWQPDFVVYEPLGFLGPVLADALSIPSLRLLWATDSARKILRIEDELLGSLADRIGAQRPNILGDVTLDPCPPGLQVEAPDIARQPMRYVPYNGPAVLPAHLRTPPSRRRIAVSWGGSLHDLGWHDGILGPRIVQALAGHDVEIVIATNDAQRPLYTDLPDNVTHIGPVALHLLLPTCDAIVHQGGAGTTMTATATATPQLILPWAVDAIVNSQQVEKTGAGRHLWPVDLDDATLKATLAEFLDHLPEHQKAATELHTQHLALPAPTTIAEQLGSGVAEFVGAAAMATGRA